MSPRVLSDDDIQAEAESIANDIWDSQIKLPGNDTRWIGYNSSDGNPVMVKGNGLHGGQIGIAVYFAAMYEITRNNSYRRHVDGAVEKLFETTVDDLINNANLGAGTGVGSYIYGLMLLSELLDDSAYRNRANKLVQGLSQESIEKDNRYDVLCGAAGAILTLLAFWERTGNNDALDTAVQCGKHLLDNRHEKWNAYKVWDTSRKGQPHRIRTGMGHGAGGIGYALYRLYRHTNDEAFRRAAESALSFENLFYSAYENNWKANPTNIKHYPHWWCNGLIGVGTARLGSLKYHQAALLERDLDRAKRGLNPQLLPDDSICHGTFGQIDLLIELGRNGDNHHTETARQLASQAIERRQNDGSYHVVFDDVPALSNPALFLGTAGIGYTLLRLLQPETIPCLLRFE